MIKKLFLIAFIFLSVKVSVAQSTNVITPPTITNFRIESSTPDRVYFDSSEAITGSNTTGFVISEKIVSGVTINSGQTTGHYFTVTSEFSFWDNNTIRYGGGSDIQYADDIALHDFTLSYIINNIPEPESTVNRYVTTSANGGGDGLTESTAWKLTEAFSKSTSGMTIWIKAGNYGNQNLFLKNSGTSSQPIKFIGYKSAIGDITSNYYDYGVTMDATEMPTFTGANAELGEAIWIFNASYIFFRNIQITNYKHGFRANASGTPCSNIVFDRFNGKTFGGNSQIDAYAIDFQTHGVLDGHDAWVGNKNIRVLNSVVVNCSMASVVLFGDGSCLVDNVKSYNDRTGTIPRQDYHIAFNGHNSIVRNCYVENFNTTRTNMSTHGIGVRGSIRFDNTYNLIEKSVGVNITEPFYIRNHGCEYNVIKDCVVKNNENSANYKSKENTGAVWIWGGSNYNIIERVTSYNTTFGIGFKDNGEEPHPDTAIGHDNIIRNCIFNKTKYAIYSQGTSSSKVADLVNNKIINCVFNDSYYLFKQYNTNVENLEIINCSITNIYQGFGTIDDSDLVYTYSNFHNNVFATPSGEGNISVDPKFEDAVNNKFKLRPDSQLIDAGKFLGNLNSDFEGNVRPQGDSHDIGAYEYPDDSTSFINANAGSDVEICQGESTTLNATGDGDFLWSTGETSASIVVTPDSTTTYTVTITNAGETDSDEVTVTVESQPSVTLGDDIIVCSGEDVILTAEGIGNFLWSTGEITASITINPSVTTTYTVTASNSCTASETDSIIVDVISGINLDAGNDVTICLGDSVTLSVTSNGDFLWSTGETTDSITIAPITTTTYTITSSLGNCSLTKEVIVTVESPPSVILENDITICSGESVVLTAEGTGNFLWNTGETTASIIVNPSATTTYTVTASSCGTDIIDDIIVNVTPEIILDAGIDVIICSGEEVILIAQSNGDFLWNTGETTASITVNPTTNTTYTVTSSLGNCSLSDEVNVTVEDQPLVNLGNDTSICYGEYITLIAEGTGDFLWSTGETTASIMVNPLSTTTYSVTANSCNTVVTDEIIVNVTPEITLYAGEDVITCSGENVVLIAEGNGDFLWNTGETTASITVNPNTTTTYTVTSSLGNCSLSDEVNIIIVAPPSVSLSLGGDITICSVGNEITLMAEGSGNLLWSTGETGPIITVNPTTTTTYTVGTTNSCGEIATDEILVTVNEPVVANVGDDVVINEGQSVILTASGGGEYFWSTGETTASIIVNPNQDTTYYVEVSNNGCTDSDDIKVTVGEAILMINSALDMTICEGEEAVLEAKGGVNYLWNTGEVTTIIHAKPEVTTTYYVSALRNGIIETAEITVNVNDCSDNSSNRISNLEVYPNPTQGIINIFLPELREKVRLSLVSLNGSLIYNKEVKADNNGIFTQIDLSNMAKGIYFLRMYNDNFNETKKILII